MGKQLLPDEVVGEKDVDPEGQYPKPHFLTTVTETYTFDQDWNQTNNYLLLTEVMAEDVLEAYIVEDREEEIKQNCWSAMRIQQEILNMMWAEGLAEPAIPPAASKVFILEVNLSNSFHKIFIKVSSFQITI